MKQIQAFALLFLISIISGIVGYNLLLSSNYSIRDDIKNNQTIDNLVKGLNEKVENKTISNTEKVEDNTPIKIITNEDSYHLSGILNKFTKTTGIKTELAFTEDSMLSRLKNREEGQLVFNKISSELVIANEKNLFVELPSDITANIPNEFKSPDNKWSNLSYRLRSFYIKKGLKDYPKTYEELSDPKYKNKICIRPLSHTYNIQLIAYMIVKHGEEYVKTWLEGLNNNLALVPSGSDRDQVRNIFEGKCEIAVANSYYMGLMLSDGTQRDWAGAVNLFFPNQEENGSLALFNGIAITKEGQNNPNVKKLIEFMYSPLGQEYLALSNFEYPITGDINSEMIKSFGKFQNLKPEDIKIDNTISQIEIAKARETALLLVKELPIK